ncbi:gp436 family protein [Maritimibacter alkaliphilus]|uniref:gp436 family protein n=1 Tax=Maritimibacter alkaliphilus TaxID=404236 RepID=UPI001C973EBA|nr:DUF1320 domain-containing protein [Maritimibacter alkaliphilus]MBY6091071.1 DUF1320 domain-containing protein [Maritimibacter alkaliphilus]
MPSYASLSELKAGIPPRDLVQLTDFDSDADQVDDARLQAALDDASAEIDSRIAKAVTLPMAEPPRMLAVLCRDLAVHRLYSNVGMATEAQTKLRAEAVAFLEKVGRGELSLGGTGDAPPQTTSPGVAMTDGPERLLTRDRLKGF